MKRSEFKAWFNTFYDSTYNRAMSYCMAKTGDFVNSEDILADSYYMFYKYALKNRDDIKSPENYFFKVLKNRIAKYWDKHYKEQDFAESISESFQYEELLEIELDLTAEYALKKMLVQDILEFVSAQPGPVRRAFVLHFYLGCTLEETASELGVSLASVRNYIYRTLTLIREKFLDDYE